MESPASPEAAATALDREAKTHMQRGLALLAENTPESLRAALPCFDVAIALRSQLPLVANPLYRYGLTAAWLNKGDALTRLGSAEDLRAAEQSFDHALAQLRELPFAENPLFVRRLGIAWMNRGVALQGQGTPAAIVRAADSFAQAIAAAEHFFALRPAEGRELLACAWMNRGNALIHQTPPDATAARFAELQALNLCRVAEATNASLADIGFKARHILCQALAHLISPGGRASPRDPNKTHGAPSASDAASTPDFFSEATDTVDEGMALARAWEARGVTQFQSQSADLFHFGCRVYQAHQPHFLTEFLLENLDPARSDGAFAGNLRMHASAADALWRMLGELHHDGFQSLNTARFDRLLAGLREMRVTEERLAVLRREAN